MKPEYHIVSFSGGKDSTAMLLRMLELGYRIDEVIFCDTGKDFPALIRHVEAIEKVVKEAGIKFVRLKAEHTFDYFMFEKEVHGKDGEIRKGYDWPGPKNRWCTGYLKINEITKYRRELKQKYNVVEYVGIAADEQERLKRKNNNEHKHPLIDWGWNEAQCLEYCYNKGYDWEGLYNYYPHVSCYCCPLQTLKQLRATKEHYPELWEELRAMDNKARRKIRADYSISELETLFDLQREFEAQGKSTRSREFYNAYKERKNDD